MKKRPRNIRGVWKWTALAALVCGGVVYLYVVSQREPTLVPAQKIVAGRPYHSLADERAGILRGVVEKLSPPAVIRSIETGLPPDPQRLDASPVIPRGSKP
jgi:hypothetical protein